MLLHPFCIKYITRGKHRSLNIFSDCTVLDPQNWYPIDGPQTVDECKSSCSEDDQRWQWINFDNNVCHCIEILQSGKNVCTITTNHICIKISQYKLATICLC